MKNLKIIVVGLLLMLLLAIPVIVSAQGSPVVLFSEGQYGGPYSVAVSSSTYTLIHGADAKTLVMDLFHFASNNVNISTCTSPGASNTLPLGTSTYMNLEINTFTGPIYGKADGTSPITVYYWLTTR